MIKFDKKINKIFEYWLTITLLLVFSTIIIGGLTRLTDSGLSITKWELFTGIIPPLNESDWLKYFSLYKIFSLSLFYPIPYNVIKYSHQNLYYAQLLKFLHQYFFHHYEIKLYLFLYNSLLHFNFKLLFNLQCLKRKIHTEFYTETIFMLAAS